jgi:predicted site-specific integrase-resolvase
VSSRKQLSSIDKQKELLLKAYPEGDFKYDVASGFNFKRQHFVKILKSCLQGHSIKIVSTTPDRLSRSGLNLIVKIIEFYSGEVEFLEDNNKAESFDTATLIAFLTSFCNSQSGKRSHLCNKKDTGLPEK